MVQSKNEKWEFGFLGERNFDLDVSDTRDFAGNFVYVFTNEEIDSIPTGESVGMKISRLH